MGKCFKNTKKDRSQIPPEPGAYTLKNKGETCYYGESNNVQRRVKEHNRDKSKHFDKVCVTPTRSKAEANKIEANRLKNKRPPLNKKRK